MNIEAIINVLRTALPELQAVYVFGSHAQGVAGPERDLDLAALVAGYAEPLKLWSLRYSKRLLQAG